MELTKHGELIDLESLGDIADEAVEVIRIENAYVEEEAKRSAKRKASKIVRYTRPSPSITGPWQRLEYVIFDEAAGIKLKPNKTVELKEDGFIRIKDIIRNTQSQEIRIRVNRLQRVKHLNGLLEKKMNELVLFLEVDLDDPRGPIEQSATEVKPSDIAKLRNVRYTNHKFPLSRNFNAEDFCNTNEAAFHGGLTVRWKYTCTYANAADRHHNVFKERTLERLNKDECNFGFGVSGEDCRTLWRGETVRGGAYQPTVEGFGDIPVLHIPIHRPPHVVDLTAVSDHIGSSQQKKRIYIAVDLDPPTLPAKRVRCQVTDEGEETRKAVGKMCIRDAINQSSTFTHHSSTPNMVCSPVAQVVDLSSDHSRMMDLITSDTEMPDATDMSQPTPPAPKPPITRSAGQKYTYGDASCGAGGATRGATMAGLRVKWGFDFNKHACATWQANLPQGKCYSMAAHEFVDKAKRAQSRGQPDMVKVDILHLSPPCQFFSPAHTINGQDDEMNVASLFAVQSVIEVTRPRVVTLEQTFGITCPRFRYYFNALVQMFTMHDFSVRWSIVPLAQWVSVVHIRSGSS